MRKIAISIRADTLREADRLAKRLGTSRSGLISALLSGATRRTRQGDISRSWDLLFREQDIVREQERMTREVYRGERFGDEDDDW